MSFPVRRTGNASWVATRAPTCPPVVVCRRVRCQFRALYGHKGLTDTVGWWESTSTWTPLKNTLLLLFSLPSCYVFAVYMCRFRRQVRQR